MPKDTKQHLATSAVLASIAAAGIVTAYQVAEAKVEGIAASVRVETVDVDFEQTDGAPSATETTESTTEIAQADSTIDAGSTETQSQFLFLFALTVLGMVGIVNLMRDLRHERSTRSRR